MIILPSSFTPQGTQEILTGKGIRASHYEQIIENQHRIYGDLSAYTSGWRYQWGTRSGSFSTVNESSADPGVDLNHWQPVLMPARETAGDELIVGFAAFCMDVEIRCRVYAANRNLIATFTDGVASADYAWLEVTTAIDLDDVTIGGVLRPVTLLFDARELGFSEDFDNQIPCIQPFEPRLTNPTELP